MGKWDHVADIKGHIQKMVFENEMQKSPIDHTRQVQKYRVIRLSMNSSRWNLCGASYIHSIMDRRSFQITREFCN